MVELGAISILVDDPSVLAALKFALTIEGFRISEGDEGDIASQCAGALVVDERYLGDGIASIEQMRGRGWEMPAIILSTNPSARLRERVNAVQGELVEKPLLDDALSGAIRRALETGGN